MGCVINVVVRFEIISVCFVVAICDLVHDVKTYTWPMLTVNSIFLK